MMKWKLFCFAGAYRDNVYVGAWRKFYMHLPCNFPWSLYVYIYIGDIPCIQPLSIGRSPPIVGPDSMSYPEALLKLFIQCPAVNRTRCPAVAIGFTFKLRGSMKHVTLNPGTLNPKP